jgi:hypothetical protein
MSSRPPGGGVENSDDNLHNNMITCSYTFEIAAVAIAPSQ